MTNIQQELGLKTYFVEVTANGGGIVNIYKWHAESVHEAEDDIAKVYRDEIPNLAFIKAYEVK